jgi:hypothetical protein
LAAQSRPACPGPSVADNFFPRGELYPRSSEVDEFDQHWYSQHLRAMYEPSLSCGLRDDEEVYRFLWLPTFQHPVAVRITRTHDGATLDVTELTGAGGYEPGTVGAHDERKLTNGEWESLLGVLGALDFWNMPTNAPPRADMVTFDGAEWILEGYRAGTYHVINRSSSDASPYVNACLRFMDLAKHTVSSKD